MMSTEQARALVSAADRQKARLLLIGDRQQLPAIEAGGPFAMLLERGMQFTEMCQVKRQTDPTLLAAVMDSIARREAAALQKLSAHTYAIADRDARIDGIVQDYLARSTEQREQTLIMTGVNDDRREINERIRRALRREQVLKGAELQASVLVQRDLIRPELTQPKSYQIGDIIRFGRSYARLGVTQDQYLMVTRIDVEQGVVELQRGSEAVVWEPRRFSRVEVYREELRTLMAGDRMRWTRNDRDSSRRNGDMAVVVAVDADRGVANVVGSSKNVTIRLDRERHWEHAYASTVHAPQGQTVDRVLVHLDTRYEKMMGSESFYVASAEPDKRRDSMSTTGLGSRLRSRGPC